MIRICLILAVLSALNHSGHAFIADVERYRDERNADGATLSSLIEPFAQYGKPVDGSVRVVISGAVNRPGIYYLESGTTLLEAIQSAGIIDYSQHPARTYLQRVRLYREGYKSLLLVDATDEENPLIMKSGDVVNVPAFLL